uniref:Serine protease 16 n=1 Tax=Rhinopithecus bieti TaxID=61621 RepID=A0A2K6LJ61_RHIBE
MTAWLAQWLGPLLLVSLWGLSAPASLLRRLGEHIQQFQESSAQGLGLSLGPGAAALPKVGWLEQLLDPFNMSDSLGQKCLSFSRAETVAQLRSTEPQLSGVGDRQWLYQTCTEFGFYVTCENPRCPFSQLPALPSQLDLCEKVFGLSALSVAQAVAQTNSYYGGQTPGASQVLFVNGDTDPWHVLSVTQALGSSESALLIRTGSHCLDMAPERPSDSPSLRLGQNLSALQTLSRHAKGHAQVKGES